MSDFDVVHFASHRGESSSVLTTVSFFLPANVTIPAGVATTLGQAGPGGGSPLPLTGLWQFTAVASFVATAAGAVQLWLSYEPAGAVAWDTFGIFGNLTVTAGESVLLTSIGRRNFADQPAFLGIFAAGGGTVEAGASNATGFMGTLI